LVRRSDFAVAAGLLVFTSAPGLTQQDPLRIFNGVWQFLKPPGQHFVVDVGVAERTFDSASGQTKITVSDGRSNSNFKIAVGGVECFYLINQSSGPKRLTWELKTGHDGCPKSVQMEQQPVSGHVRDYGSPIEACDSLASHPDDETRPLGTSGTWGKPPVHVIAECQDAVAARPDDARMAFQLGRVMESLVPGWRGPLVSNVAAVRLYRRAAEAGHLGAMQALGQMYEHGRGVPTNLTAAVVWYRRAAEAGHVGAMLDLGRMHESGRGVPMNVEETLGRYRRAAEAGNSQAMVTLGEIYEAGRVVARSDEVASGWYLRALEAQRLSDKEQVKLKRALAAMYREGRGLHQDNAEANRLEEEASVLLTQRLRGLNGIWSFMPPGSDAQSRVAFDIRIGAREVLLPFGRATITASDRRMGASFEASVAGDCLYSISLFNDPAPVGPGEQTLVWELTAGHPPCPQALRFTQSGRPHDHEQPLASQMCDRFAADPRDKTRPPDVPGVARLGEYFDVPLLACQDAFADRPGDVRVAYQLGRVLWRIGRFWERGPAERIAGDPFYAEAVRLYRKAAEAGHVAGMNALGDMYEYGHGVPHDFAEAVVWFRKAAEAGHVAAKGSLGWMYASGRGVPKDDVEALGWFLAAAEAGHLGVMGQIGIMYEEGRGVPRDDAEAARWYLKVVGTGSTDQTVRMRLAKMYREGRGVSRDDQEASRLDCYRRMGRTYCRPLSPRP